MNGDLTAGVTWGLAALLFTIAAGTLYGPGAGLMCAGCAGMALNSGFRTAGHVLLPERGA